MTFEEITRRRIELGRSAEKLVEGSTECDIPAWMRVALKKRVQSIEGIAYQRCGGGRRVIRKKLGGA